MYLEKHIVFFLLDNYAMDNFELCTCVSLVNFFSNENLRDSKADILLSIWTDIESVALFSV